MTPFDFQTVPDIRCALGSSAQLSTVLKNHGWQGRVFFVTDPGVRKAGLIDAAVDDLTSAGLAVDVFSEVSADPPEALVWRAAQLARDTKPACVIGFGGGSAMDVAKLVAILAGTDQVLSTMYGVGNVKDRRRLPLVLVPTTAGTGSEVTPISIVTTGATTKMGVVSPQLLADVAVLDAELTLGLPRHVTAHTGIDAMVHAIEAYTSRHKKNAMSDGKARQALQLLWQHLPEVLADPQNSESRQAVLMGACLAGQAFANAPVAAVHALAYPVGGMFHVTHGLSNALVLPHVLQFNLPNAHALYGELSQCTGGSASPADFLDGLEKLCVASGIERRLRDVGIAQNDVATLATAAMDQQRLLINNPREVALANAHAIYEKAW
jgi:alcohol dehydrogenase class IV